MRLMPSGSSSNLNTNWVPSEKKMHKSASDGIDTEMIESESDDSKDALYNAAKEVVEAMEGENVENVDNGENGDFCPKAIEDSVILDIEEVPESEIGEALPGEEAVEEISEDVAVESVEEAVEKVEEAVEDLKVVVEDAEEVVENEGIEEVVEDEGEEEIVVDEEPIEDEKLVIESEPEVENDDDVSMDKSASVEEEFTRFAKLSEQNKSKIKHYWKDVLKYPADYVDLMAKEYE